MTFNPDPNRHDQILDAPIVEYLGSQPCHDGEHVLAVLSVRFFPATSFASHNFCLTQTQAIRLRDDLHGLLTNPDSWLFTPNANDGGDQ